MAKEQLSAIRRRELMNELEGHWDELQHQSRLVTSQYSLDWTVSIMKQLGLSSWHGRTYQEWKLVSEYVGRNTFTRRLKVELGDVQINAVAGGEDGQGLGFGGLPLRPGMPKLELTMESSVNRRLLVCRLGLRANFSEVPYLDKYHLSVSFTEDGSRRAHARLTIHFVDWRQTQQNTRGGCTVYGCKSHHEIYRTSEVERAYEAGGITHVWHLLDRIWSDTQAARPLFRPLSPAALAVRCLVHQDYMVKVLTRGQPIVGRLVGDYRSMQPRDYIQLEPVESADHKTVVQTGLIPAVNVYEILPWRLDT